MAGFEEYEDYDGLGLAGLVKRGDVGAEEILAAAIERVEARNPAVNAVVQKLYDHGREQIAAGLPDGPFKGVPFLLKDLGSALAGTRTTRGSRFFADLPPMSVDSLHVTRLKKAGMVIFGKSNTCEVGLSLTCEPQSRSCMDRRTIPGTCRARLRVPAVARRRPSARACCRSPTPRMVSARYEGRRRLADWSACARLAAATRCGRIPVKA